MVLDALEIDQKSLLFNLSKLLVIVLSVTFYIINICFETMGLLILYFRKKIVLIL